VIGANVALYIEVPYEPVWRQWDGAGLPKKRHWHEHVNFFTPTSLRRLVEAHGLTVQDCSVREVDGYKPQEKVDIIQLIGTISNSKN